MTKSDSRTRCRTCAFIHDPNKHHFSNGLCKNTDCASKPMHAFLLCEAVIKANANNLAMNQLGVSVSQFPVTGSFYEPVDTETLNLTLNIDCRKSRTTALETAVLTAMNPEANHLPPHMRQIPLMTDTGAQRSVIAKQ